MLKRGWPLAELGRWEQRGIQQCHSNTACRYKPRQHTDPHLDARANRHAVCDRVRSSGAYWHASSDDCEPLKFQVMQASVASAQELQIAKLTPAREGHSWVIVRLSRRNDGLAPLPRIFENQTLTESPFERPVYLDALKGSTNSNSLAVLRDPAGALHAMVNNVRVSGSPELLPGLRDIVTIFFDAPTANLQGGLGTLVVLTPPEISKGGTQRKEGYRDEIVLREARGLSPLARGQTAGLRAVGEKISVDTAEFVFVAATSKPTDNRISMEWKVKNVGNEDISLILIPLR
jgi:hypothetical protein